MHEEEAFEGKEYVPDFDAQTIGRHHVVGGVHVGDIFNIFAHLKQGSGFHVLIGGCGRRTGSDNKNVRRSKLAANSPGFWGCS